MKSFARISASLLTIDFSAVKAFHLSRPVVLRSDDHDPMLKIVAKLCIQSEIVKGIDFQNVYESNDTIFPYFDSAISKHYGQFRPEYDFVDLDYPNTMCGPVKNSSKYHYYSGNLMQPEFSHLHAVLHPRKLFKEPVLSRVSSNVWVGETGVKAPAHYDAVNNVYIQLTGKVTASCDCSNSNSSAESADSTSVIYLPTF